MGGANDRAPRLRRLSPWGFSLLEILIAVTILGILAALVGPKVADYAQRTKLDGAAQQLLGDLERARTEAIKRNSAVTLEMTSATTYTISSVGSRSLDGATVTSGSDSVRFAPFGPPTTGAATFVLTAGGRTRTISVNDAGHVSVQ